MTQSKITVLFPVYNALPHLKYAVESLIEQTYQDFIVLAYNDGSTDGSADYLNSITDSRFKVIHQDNVGLAVTLNRMLRLVNTEYVARMDADDISLPCRFKRQTEFLDAHPEVAVLGTRAGYVFLKNSPLKIGFGNSAKTLTYSPPMADPPYWDPLIDDEILTHCSVMMRTSKLKEIGGYPEIVPGQDLALWHLFALKAHKLASLDEMLVLFRISKGGISASNLSNQNFSWRYIKYKSNCAVEGAEPVSFEEFQKLHPMSESDIHGLCVRAKIRNSVGEFLEGNFACGIAGLVVHAVSNPRVLWEKILKRI